MKIDIITLFPEMFMGPFDESIIKKAKDKKLIEINLHNLRNWATDKHKTVDDRPFGGGAGMILKVDILHKTVTELFEKAISSNQQTKINKSKIILLDASGKKYTQKTAQLYSKLDYLQIVCGHYEGIDYRVQKYLVDDVVSIGDYILTGGEIPAMAIVDSIVRLIPGAIDPKSLLEESFTNNNIEYPQYTRPSEFLDWKVPEVLLSGNHKEIDKWRRENQKSR